MTEYLADQITGADIARVREERDRELSGKPLEQPLTTDEMQAEAYRQVLGDDPKRMPHHFKIAGESYADAMKRWDRYQAERERASAINWRELLPMMVTVPL